VLVATPKPTTASANSSRFDADENGGAKEGGWG
jgi:hypothetical protein